MGDKGPGCEYLDLDRAGRCPRRAGDRFHPLGLAGEKKLGKFLTTARVPREVREHILVFADREKIVWVCPVRIAEPAKVTNETRHILMLKVTR
jgi:tRNA(Ile)-lysidine synthase